MKKCTLCGLPETHETIRFNEKGICNICEGQSIKQNINWEERLSELDELIASYKGKYNYDLILPFSGGKDSTWTLYFLKKRYPDLRPLVVRFNHGFLRSQVKSNCIKVFKNLGCNVLEFTPNWHAVRLLMLQALIDKADFCWHCHSGIYAYPIRVAVNEEVPLVMWGEPSTEYTAYYSYENKESVDEEQFNKFRNLGISADDMYIRLFGHVDERDLAPFRYPPPDQLKWLGLHSVCLGDYIPWDVKKQVSIIQNELNWKGELVENVPSQYNYEKIECWMQGSRDYIKHLKRGYSRVSHLTAIDLRNQRIDKVTANKLVDEFEGRVPYSLNLLLEYLGISLNEFYDIVSTHEISPWSSDNASKISIPSHELPDDVDTWHSKDGLPRTISEDILQRCSIDCNSCQ